MERDGLDSDGGLRTRPIDHELSVRKEDVGTLMLLQWDCMVAPNGTQTSGLGQDSARRQDSVPMSQPGPLSRRIIPNDKSVDTGRAVLLITKDHTVGSLERSVLTYCKVRQGNLYTRTNPRTDVIPPAAHVSN